MFSSKSDEWSTPPDFYAKLDAEFHLELDPCATLDNHKCDRYYTPEMNGLKQSWGQFRVFCNPPYSQLKAWIEKCHSAAVMGATVVLLIPARTDTKAFHQHIYDLEKWEARPGVKIRFLKGRLKFGGCSNSAPFPSMVVIFN